MSKQILYPSFVTRIFATTIDLFIITTIMRLIVGFIAIKLFTLNFHEYILRYEVDLQRDNAVYNAMIAPEFQEYFTVRGFFMCGIVILLVEIMTIVGYFTFFWHKFGCTPGKYALGIRIIDKAFAGNPEIGTCIMRVVFYGFGIINIWFISFIDKHQALHDKLSGTIVIKR